MGTKLMLTCMAITMAVTPFLSTLGEKISTLLEIENFVTSNHNIAINVDEINSNDDFAIVIGYGSLGKIVCNLLDKKNKNYVCLEIDRGKVIDANSNGLS